MIQIYKKENKNFEYNGDMTLTPESFEIKTVLNGSWSAEMFHILDDKEKWTYIEEDAVIKAPSFNGDQLFRIKKIEKSDSGINVILYPIFFDSSDDCFLIDVRPTGKTGQQALDIMCAINKKYSGISNIESASTAYYETKNLMQAINGDDENSFVNRWGGEIIFNNFTVEVNKRAGVDNGTEVVYGKNIPKNGLRETIDTTQIVTRIYPKAYNGYTVTGNGYVDSVLIDKYPVVKARVMKFEDVKMREDAQEDDESNGIIICDSQIELNSALTQRCNEQFELGIDKPEVTLEIDMELLQNTDLYKDFEILEEVRLGDTVHCRHDKFGIISDARIMELVYDSVKRKTASVVLGNFKKNYFNNVASIVDKIEQSMTPDGSLMAERVQGILNGIYTQLKLQSTAAKKVNGRAFMVEDTDPDSELYGCMVWGTQGLQLAVSRTADDRDWDWTTAITAKGIAADAVITGILSDKLGKNYWNLDTGEFRLSAEAFKVDDQTVQDYVDGKIDEKLAKIRTLNMALSNEFQGVFTKSDGTGGDYTDCYTYVQLFIGTVDITSSSQVRYTTATSGCTGAWDATLKRYTVLNMTSDNAYVDITASYMNLHITKRFSLVKVRQGGQGIPGEKGNDGKQLYTWLKYADTPTSGMSESPDGKKYMGLAYNKDTAAESSVYSDYAWSLIKGEGVPGPPGDDGKPKYTWVKYGDSLTGDGMSDSPDGKSYIGLAYNKDVATESTNPKDYLWSLIKGEDGKYIYIQSSEVVIKQGADKVFLPKNVTFSSYIREGANAPEVYRGRYKIYESTTGSAYTLKYASSMDEASKIWTPSSADVKLIKCELYESGGTTAMADRQSVTVVRDIDNLTQEEVFNILTDNGKVQGLFMQDGQLYFNGEYIQVKDLKAFGATIAGWEITSSDIVKTYNMYSDMSASGLSGVGDNDPVQRWVWMRSPKSETDAVLFVGYKKKSDYLKNVNTVYPVFRARANGAVYCKDLTMEGGSVNIQSNDFNKSVITLRYNDGIDSGFMEINPYWVGMESGEDFYRIGPRTGLVVGKKTGSVQVPKAWIDSDGGVTCVSLKQTSDRREKKSIDTIKDNFAKNFIKNLVPVEFKFRDNEELKHMGFIAQDLQDIITDDYGVVKEENDRLSVAYTEIIAPLVKVVQELQMKEEKRCKRWQRLKQLIYRLKGKVFKRKSR